MNFLYRGKRSTLVALLVLTGNINNEEFIQIGDLTEGGNSIKQRFISVPFSGANVSEIITTHQVKIFLLILTD
jgi:hypothetical protein